MKLFFDGRSKYTVSKSADGLEGILCTEELRTTHMSKDYAKVVSNFASEVEAGESK
jgi:hypothetical protein